MAKKTYHILLNGYTEPFNVVADTCEDDNFRRGGMTLKLDGDVVCRVNPEMVIIAWWTEEIEEPVYGAVV